MMVKLWRLQTVNLCPGQCRPRNRRASGRCPIEQCPDSPMVRLISNTTRSVQSVGSPAQAQRCVIMVELSITYHKNLRGVPLRVQVASPRSPILGYATRVSLRISNRREKRRLFDTFVEPQYQSPRLDCGNLASSVSVYLCLP